MTQLADRSIDALRAHHDDLGAVAASLDAEQLAAPSGATEWTVAQVLSHLGSGAEIMLKSVAAVTGSEANDEDNESIWARWNGSTPEEQAAAYVEHDRRLVTALEGIDAAQRDEARIDLGFMPEPVPLDVVVGMRLNEVAAHGWDVHVGLDPDAALDDTAAGLLLEHFSDGLGFMLGFTGKPETVEGGAVVAAGDVALVVADPVQVSSDAGEPTATFAGPARVAGAADLRPPAPRAHAGGRRRDRQRHPRPAARGLPRLLRLRRRAPGDPRGRAVRVRETAGGQVDQPQPQGAGDRAEHLGAGLLAAALDLGEVGRRDAGSLGHVGEGALLAVPLLAQLVADRLAPQRLARRRPAARAAGRRSVLPCRDTRPGDAAYERSSPWA